MKKLFLTIFFALGLAALLPAQFRSAHYEVIVPPGSADGTIYANQMEQRFDAYNKIFQFDPDRLSGPLRIRLFTEKGEYDGYVTSKLGSSRPGAVYLHYNNPANRELVIHRGSAEEEKILPHQAFVQFFRAFIPHPPAWMREGFAVYFSTLAYNRERGALSYEENLSWLETVRQAGAAAGPELILRADTKGTPPNFQALAWSLVSFFVNNGSAAADSSAESTPGGGSYFRTLTDLFMVLSPGASAEENAQAVYDRIVLFRSIRDLTGDYTAYMAAKKTFTELVEEGQRAYGAGDFAAAGTLFRRAAALKAGHYAPCYYLGLLAYEEARYAEAEGFYKTALEYGAERALIQYARGINAVASGNKKDGLAYLEEAAAADPSKYKARVEELVKKLE
jgi:tetratricopeptide (TPR) repeat protein